MVYKQAMKGFLRAVIGTVLISLLVYQGMLFLFSAEWLNLSPAFLPETLKNTICISHPFWNHSVLSLPFGIAQTFYIISCFFFLFSGGGIVFKLQKRGLLDFYLSRAVSRRRCYMSLWWRGLTYAAVFSLLLGGGMLGYLYCQGGLHLYPYTSDTYGWSQFDFYRHMGFALRLSLRTFLVWLMLYSIGLCFGAMCKGKGKSRMLAVLPFLVMYASGILYELFPQLSFLLYGVIFHAALPHAALSENILFLWHPFPLLAVLLLASLFGGLSAFARRDLPEEIGG